MKDINRGLTKHQAAFEWSEGSNVHVSCFYYILLFGFLITFFVLLLYFLKIKSLIQFSENNKQNVNKNVEHKSN